MLTNESGGPIEEFSVLVSVEHVLSLSEKDRQLAQNFCTLPSFVVDDFVPPDWHARVRRDHAERYSLLFFAISERPENLDAVRWLVLEVLPAIQLALPGVNVTVMGNAGDRLAKELASASVQGTGYVEDPLPYFSRCRLMISSADSRRRCQVQDA